MKTLAAILALMCAGLLLAAAPATEPGTAATTAPVGDDTTALTISAASSLQDALREIAPAYEQSSSAKLHFNFLGSGQLMTQIEQGASVDVFISASVREVQELAARHLVFGEPIDIASNELVLITPPHATVVPKDFIDLADEQFKRIAIGEPGAVPAGDYAAEVLRTLDIAAKVKPRLVYGANVRQVLEYVKRGEVDAGIVYKTDAREAGDSVRLIVAADPQWHSPIRYQAAVIESSANKPESRAFLKYLLSDAGQKVLLAHGFRPPAPPSP